jgi:ABC-type lipoprotein export system ATPase subunit
LRDVELQVEEGEFLVISGPSGSGKTTLLSIIGGLEKPTSGSLELFGKSVDEMSDEELSNIRLKEIGFIFQEQNLLPFITVSENIELPMTLANIPKTQRKERVQELLKSFSLEHLSSRFPYELSMGERQRIAAIRAMANKPRLILGDEPTSGLDRDNALILLRLLKEINSRYGTTIVLTTTDPELLRRFSSRNLLLVNGSIQL